MVTTIKLQDYTKAKLDKIKKSNQTYDDIVQDLLANKQTRNIVAEMIVGYESRELDKETKEWEQFDQ
ncbi:MAG: putative CopG family antitoxin [Candidatus Woesearchaeota archaeon]|jgi:predicted CopG family antitoxin